MWLKQLEVGRYSEIPFDDLSEPRGSGIRRSPLNLLADRPKWSTEGELRFDERIVD